jgi:serine/threonine-protein kinase
MALAPGTRLGPYEIESPLGAGGMGEVYRARDTRLDRLVAIKVLSPSLASDPQFRARFENEARAISALDHPHICALYDVGEHDGTAFIVMQYLEGETLAARLSRGAMPLSDALQSGQEIANALAKAHRAGIVHRDLKPGNIMLTKSGAKLLDFGLARSVHSGSAQALLSAVPTVAPDLTAKGTILGTFQYMAPEQLEGKEADARTDIFAFGSVLYEMLTGRRAFEGKSQASLIAAILEHEPPPLTTVQPLRPLTLDRVVKTCLAKDPDSRWQSSADIARELKWMSESDGAQLPGTRAPATTRRAVMWGAIGLGAGVLVGAVLMWLALPWVGPAQHPVNTVQSFIDVAPADWLRSRADDETTSAGHLSRTAIALSPDGQTIVFSAVKDGRQQLYARPLVRLEATPLPGTDEGNNPFFSPDGQWVGFWARGAIKKVRLSGGEATIVCETATIFGASCGSNDQIVFALSQGGLWQVSAAGGKQSALTQTDIKAGEVSHRLPQWLPGNRAVMFTVTRTMLPRWDDTQVVVRSLDGNGRTLVLEGAADARYVSTGHILFVRRGTLNAAPFDLERLRVTGGGVTLVSDLMQAANMTNSERLDSGAGEFSVSPAGTLAYVKGGIYTFPERSLVWVDRTGRVEPLGAPSRAYIYPRLSTDGNRLLVSTQGDRNVWLYDIARGPTTLLTVDGRNMAAIWTPDGKRFTFGSSSSGQENLFWKPADGSGSAERLTDSPLFQRPSSWSPDGSTLALVQGSGVGANAGDVFLLTPTGDRQPRPIFATRFNEEYPEFSPDGRWIAYVSNESGQSEVYVAPYPGPGPKVPVSVSGGLGPAWTKNGRELLYLAPLGPQGTGPYRMMSVALTNGQSLSIGTPRRLFDTPLGVNTNIRGYDLSPDGSKFLMVEPKPRTPLRPSQIVLVQNWFDELRRRVPFN